MVLRRNNEINQDWFTGINTVHHNILRIPKNTFPIIESRVKVESGRAMAQTTFLTTSFKRIFRNPQKFRLITIRWKKNNQN